MEFLILIFIGRYGDMRYVYIYIHKMISYIQGTYGDYDDLAQQQGSGVSRGGISIDNWGETVSICNASETDSAMTNPVISM